MQPVKYVYKLVSGLFLDLKGYKYSQERAGYSVQKMKNGDSRLETTDQKAEPLAKVAEINGVKKLLLNKDYLNAYIVSILAILGFVTLFSGLSQYFIDNGEITDGIIALYYDPALATNLTISFVFFVVLGILAGNFYGFNEVSALAVAKYRSWSERGIYTLVVVVRNILLVAIMYFSARYVYNYLKETPSPSVFALYFAYFVKATVPFSSIALLLLGFGQLGNLKFTDYRNKLNKYFASFEGRFSKYFAALIINPFTLLMIYPVLYADTKKDLAIVISAYSLGYIFSLLVNFSISKGFKIEKSVVGKIFSGVVMIVLGALIYAKSFYVSSIGNEAVDTNVAIFMNINSMVLFFIYVTALYQVPMSVIKFGSSRSKIEKTGLLIKILFWIILFIIAEAAFLRG